MLLYSFRLLFTNYDFNTATGTVCEGFYVGIPAGTQVQALTLPLRTSFSILISPHQSMSSDGPPWFAYDPDGEIRFGGVPDRLLHHPEILRRGIKLTNALKPVDLFQHG